MARMPGATWVGERGSRSMSRYDIVCIHTIVGYAPAHAAHFSTDGGGKIYQSRDTRYRSAANLNGNHRVIAIENADHGSGFPRWNTNGSDVPPFTSAQAEAIAQILAWAHKTHGIPLVLVSDSRPSTRGIAYHRLGCDPYRKSGGELWSSAYGKVCPGDKRIKQIPSIIARAKQIVGGQTKPEPPKEWDEMATKKEIQEAVLDALSTERGQGVQANAVAAALRDGPVARREMAEIVSEEVKVKNPVTGEMWPLRDALWSLWHYAYQAGAMSAKPDAAASHAVTIAKAPAREADE